MAAPTHPPLFGTQALPAPPGALHTCTAARARCGSFLPLHGSLSPQALRTTNTLFGTYGSFAAPDRDERAMEAAPSARPGSSPVALPHLRRRQRPSLGTRLRGLLHSPRHRGAIPGSPPSQEKPPYLLHGAAAAAGRAVAAATAAAAARSLSRGSSALPFLAFPFIHQGCRGRQRQVETTFLLEEVGSLLRTPLNGSLRLPTHSPFSDQYRTSAAA